MTYRDVTRRLASMGCMEIVRKTGGSHRKWKNPANGKTTVVPDWGGRDLKLGTIRAVVRQLGLEWDNFSNA